MPNVGTIYLDAQLDTSGMKKQITSLGKTLNAIRLNTKINVYKGDVQKQLNAIKDLHINAKVKINPAGIKQQLSKITGLTVNVNANTNNNAKQNNTNNTANVNQEKKAIVDLNKVKEQAIQNAYKLMKSNSSLRKVLDQTYQGGNISAKKYLAYIDGMIKKLQLWLASNEKLKNTKVYQHIANQSNKLNVVRNNLANVIQAQEQAIQKAQQLKQTIATVVGGTIQLGNIISSGSGSIIQNITAFMSTLGGMIGTVVGGPLVGQITSTIISVLGNITKMVVNIVSKIVNICIKVIKTGINTIKNIIKGVFNGIKNIPKVIENIISKVGKLSTSVRLLGGAITYAKNLFNQFKSIISQKFSAYSLINFSKESFNLGSALVENEHILDITLDGYASKMKDFTSKLKYTTGMAKSEATQYAASYTKIFKSMGMSAEQNFDMTTQMMQKLGDIASTFNWTYEKAYEKMQSGIINGQARASREMGLSLLVSDINEYMKILGDNRSYNTLSSYEKMMYRYQKAMHDLDYTTGDFVATQNTWANQTKILTSTLADLKTYVGQNLIMAFQPLLKILNMVLNKFYQLTYAINNFLKSVGLGSRLGNAGVAALGDELGDEADAISDASDSVGSSGSKAANEIKRSLLGFDKLLNNLSDNSKDSGSGGASGGTTSSIDLSGFNEVEDEVVKVNSLMSLALERLHKSMSKIGRFFSVLGKDFKTQFATPFVEFLKGPNGIPRLIHSISSLIDGIRWNDINFVFKSWFRSLEPLTEFFVNIGIDIQQNFINPLVQFYMNNILPSIIKTLTRFNNAVDWNEVRLGINRVLKALVPLLQTIMSVGTWIYANVLEPIGEWFLNSVWPILAEVVGSFFDTLLVVMKALQPYWMQFYNEFLVPFASIIGDKIISGLQYLNSYLDNLKEKFMDPVWVQNNFGFISEDIEQLKTDLSNFDIVAIISDVINLAIKVLEKMDETFGISDTIGNAIDKICGIVKEYVAPKIIEKIKEIWTKDISPKIPGWIENIKTAIQPMLEALGVRIVSIVTQGIIKVLMLPFTIGSDLGRAIVSFLTGIKDDSNVNENSSNIGATIVAGIIDGICKSIGLSTNVDKIKNAIKEMLNKCTFGLKNTGLNIETNFKGNSLLKNKSAIGIDAKNMPAFANGGYVHSTPGGSLVRVAEAGQGEYIFGDSQLRNVIRDEIGNSNMNNDRTIVLQVGDTEFGSWLIDLMKNEVKRTGKSLF